MLSEALSAAQDAYYSTKIDTTCLILEPPDAYTNQRPANSCSQFFPSEGIIISCNPRRSLKANPDATMIANYASIEVSQALLYHNF
jgi:hypothetical protein